MSARLDLLRRHWRSVFIFIAIVVDALSIGVSGFVAYLVRENFFQLAHIAPLKLFGVVVYSGTVFIAFALVFGLYRAAFHTRSVHQFVLASKAYFFAALFILASFYFLRWSALPRVFTALFFAFVPTLYVFGRIVLRGFNLAMQTRGFGLYRTLLVDQGSGGQHFFRRFDFLPELGYDVVGLAAWNGVALSQQKPDWIDFVHCESSDDLRLVVTAKSIERVILPGLDLQSGVIADILGVCREVGVKLTVLSQESEELLRFSRVNDIAGLPLYSPARGRVERAKRVTKRAFDIFGSILLIVALFPIIVFASLAILIEDRWPIFYSQRRALAKGRKEFDMFKFRTMVKNADSRQAELYERNQTTGGLFMLRQDPRVLKVGRLLRKLSIDEVPQLLNVLRGEMSLVGPRPLSVADLDNISPDNRLGGYYDMRAKATPGMTGLWQISGRREVGFKEMVLLDLYYIENQSIMFDLEILLATIPVVLFGKGAY